MESKIILYIAQSIDGYIATKDFSVSWLDKYQKKGNDYGYKKFFESIDTVIVGNTTQKQFPQKYEGKTTFVFSKSESGKDENITYVKGSVKEFMKKYKPKGNIWLLGGADIINQFLKEDLIDEMRIFIMPELLGAGIPLFKKRNGAKRFKLVSTKTDNNSVELYYKN